MGQMGFEPMENSLICGFGFSIRLRVCYESESMFDVEPTQELFEPLIVKLSVVIGDDRPRETIAAYYELLDERFYLKFSDVGHGLGLDPFGKIIHRDEEKFSL